MGFTESVTEVFVLFKMWSKHICFYIEGRRLVSQIKKAKKTCGWFGSFATTTMARHLAHTLKSSHESRTSDVFFLSFKIQSKPVCRTQGSNWHFKWTMRCENQKDCVNIWIPRHLFRVSEYLAVGAFEWHPVYESHTSHVFVLFSIQLKRVSLSGFRIMHDVLYVRHKVILR